MHSKMTDAERRIQAMYHLEVCFESGNSKNKTLQEIDAHITAAHYLIQAMSNGFTPDNYDDVMQKAMEFDAIDEAVETIYRAGKLSNKH